MKSMMIHDIRVVGLLLFVHVCLKAMSAWCTSKISLKLWFNPTGLNIFEKFLKSVNNKGMEFLLFSSESHHSCVHCPAKMPEHHQNCQGSLMAKRQALSETVFLWPHAMLSSAAYLPHPIDIDAIPETGYFVVLTEASGRIMDSRMHSCYDRSIWTPVDSTLTLAYRRRG